MEKKKKKKLKNFIKRPTVVAYLFYLTNNDQIT